MRIAIAGLVFASGCCWGGDSGLKLPHDYAHIYVDPELPLSVLAGMHLSFCFNDECQHGDISQGGGLENEGDDGTRAGTVFVQDDGGDRATIVTYLGSGNVGEFVPHDGDILTYDITDPAGQTRFHASFPVTYTYIGDGCNGFYTAEIVVPTGTGT